MNLAFPLIALVGMTSVQPDELEKVSLPVIPGLERADLYILKFTEHPAAILVLCPGFDANGENWIQKPAWQTFAKAHNLNVIALSFASDGELLRKGRGYYYPEQGSGQLLLDEIDREFDANTPLLLYGFSGGAHFASGFAEWKPERVMGWCAYSAGWWGKQSSPNVSPPGLIVCGNEDERYGASLIYFKQGRALGKPWLWLSVGQDSHSISPQAENFAREYFASIIATNGSADSGQWVDIDLKSNAEPSILANQPSLTGWLPNSTLLPEWREVHQP